MPGTRVRGDGTDPEGAGRPSKKPEHRGPADDGGKADRSWTSWTDPCLGLHVRTFSILGAAAVSYAAGAMARPFRLFWVYTVEQFDDGFVVARTKRSAAAFVAAENFMAATAGWAAAESIARLPEAFQQPDQAVGSTQEDPRVVHWASPEVLAACGIATVHAQSPRVFFRQNRLFTEGLLDYFRRKSDRGVLDEQHRADRLAVILGHPITEPARRTSAPSQIKLHLQYDA